MNNHTIKFTNAPDGEIEYCKGHTVYTDLFMLGAVALTSRYQYTKDDIEYEFATDAEGLKTLIMKSNETLEFMQDAIVALGLVMTDRDSEHVNENRNELNWLVIGLTELSTLVAKNLSDMNCALRSLKVSEAKEKH